MSAVSQLPPRIGSKIAVADDGCWWWLAGTSPQNYGRVYFKRTAHLAHRVVYELLVGDPGEVLHHECENPRCVNPAHLSSVTRSEHIGRLHTTHLAAWYKRQRDRTHCPRGHAFTPENTSYRGGNQGRTCRACRSEMARSRRERRGMR